MDNEVCSGVGVDILGGWNAVDAALPLSCVGVLNPSSAVLRGCFILDYHNASRTGTFYDSRETAPAAATSDIQ